MKNALLLLLILLFNTCTAFGQTCIPVYNNEYATSGNDEVRGVIYTHDKGALVFGSTTGGHIGKKDGLLLKLREDGSIQWSKTYGGAEDDLLTHARQTADGGWIVAGISKSMGNSLGEPVLLKVDLNGNIIWSKKILSEPGIHRTGDLLQTKNGKIVLAINMNDSSAAADALLIILNETGSVEWARKFDNGFADAFNSLEEQADSILVTGYTMLEANKKSGLLMSLRQSNGQLNWCKAIKRSSSNPTQSFNIETFNIQLLGDHVAFSSIDVGLYSTIISGRPVTHFRLDQSGNVLYESEVPLAAYNGYAVEYPVVNVTKDSGFVTLVNDTNSFGSPSFSKIGVAGLYETGKLLHEPFQPTKMYGLDITPDNGFLIAGHFKKTWYQDSPFHIRVLKLDPFSFSGSCSFDNSRDLTDTAHHIIESANWKKNESIQIVPFSINVSYESVTVLLTKNCSDTYCTPAISIGNQCNSTFSATMKGNAWVKLFDSEKTKEGGYFSAGMLQYYTHFEPYLVKHNPDGTTKWSKSYYRYLHSGYFKKLTAAADGTIYAIGIDVLELNHGIRYSSIIMKITEDGEVIWTKELTDAGVYNSIPLQDGGLLLCTNQNYGSGSIINLAIRLDNNGNIRWKKRFWFGAETPVMRNLFVEGSALYLLADDYAVKNAFSVYKVNIADGSLQWNKRYMAGDVDLVSAQNITKFGDTIYVMLNTNNGFTWNNTRHHPMVVKLMDTNGTFSSAFRITSNNYTFTTISQSTNEHGPITFSKVKNHLITAQQFYDNGTNFLAVTKLTPSGELVWSKKFEHLKNYFVWSVKEDGESVLIGGRLLESDIWMHTDIRKYGSFLLKLDHKGNLSENNTGTCSSIDLTYKTEPFSSVTELWNSLDSLSNDYHTNVRPVALTPRNNEIWTQLECAIADECKLIVMEGNNQICDINQSYLYKVKRNAGCTLPLNWTFDTSFVQIIGQTDSTLTLSFTKSGNTTIKAGLSGGCSSFEQGLNVTVAFSASSLKLGLDTILCPQNTLLLNAKKGFSTYRWQNGSTDSTFLVTAPGVYHVTVTDACNNVFSDTVTVQSAPPVPLSVGPDRTKCNNDTLQLEAPAGFLNYSWGPNYNLSNNNSRSVTVNPAVDTLYYVKAEKTPGCFGFDTLRIKVNTSPPIHLGPDVSFCKGDSVVLQAGSGFAAYSWNNGETTQAVSIKTQGTVTVKATTAQGCSSADTLQVLQLFANPLVQLNKDSLLCSQTTRTLDAGAFAQYRWNTGAQTRTITVTGPGIYQVLVTDANGCRGTDSTSITRMLPLPQRFLGPDTAVCSYGTLDLAAPAGFRSYLWNTGSAATKITVTQPGTYILKVTDTYNCSGADTVLVKLKECLTGFYMPNAFTPDGNGLNDGIAPLLFARVVFYEFSIYNRFGERVFHSRNRTDQWNGLFQNKPQPPGAYAWRCTWQQEGGMKQEERGVLYLVR